MEKFNTLNNGLDEIIQGRSTADQLINGLEERQFQTMKNLPRYCRITSYIAGGLIVVGLLTQILTSSTSNDQIELFQSLKRPTIGGVLSILFTVVAYFVNALFAVWAVSFIPYLVISAYKGSHRVRIPLRLHGSKWIQLFSATFFPIFAFAIFSTSVQGINSSSFVIYKITYSDGLLLLLAGCLSWLILFGATRFIPLKYIVVHLTIFSSLLYAVIFAAYILGFGIITYGAVLGMIAFLMFSSNMLGEITRRVSAYDIDGDTVDKVTAVSLRQNEIKVTEADSDIRKCENELENKVQKIKSEVQIEEQQRSIRATSIDFNGKINETKLAISNKKLETYNQVYSTFADEYKLKIDQEFPSILAAFKNDAKNMSPKELNESMNKIISMVNGSLDTIPQGLDNLNIEVQKTTKEMKRATSDLALETE